MDPYGTDMYDIICMDLGKRSFSHRVNQPCSTLVFFLVAIGILPHFFFVFRKFSDMNVIVVLDYWILAVHVAKS